MISKNPLSPENLSCMSMFGSRHLKSGSQLFVNYLNVLDWSSLRMLEVLEKSTSTLEQSKPRPFQLLCDSFNFWSTSSIHAHILQDPQDDNLLFNTQWATQSWKTKHIPPVQISRWFVCFKQNLFQISASQCICDRHNPCAHYTNTTMHLPSSLWNDKA
jgi:hypothetical protein